MPLYSPLTMLMRPCSLLVLCLLHAGVSAQPAPDPVDEAFALYLDGQTAAARDGLVALLGSDALPRDRERDGLRLLSEVYLVLNDSAAAASTMQRWIDADPVAAEASIDADNDLLEFVRLYYREQITWNEARFCPPAFEPDDPCRFGTATPEPDVQTIAIVEFDNNSFEDAGRLERLRMLLPDLLNRRFAGATRLRVVDREKLDVILEELTLNESDLVAPETATRVGRILGAQLFVFGDYFFLDNRLTIGARIVVTETTEVLPGVEVEGRLRDLRRLADELSSELASRVKVELPERAAVAPEVNSLDVLLLYAEANHHRGLAQNARAAELYEEVLESDPEFASARERLDALRPLLARADS